MELSLRREERLIRRRITPNRIVRKPASRTIGYGRDNGNSDTAAVRNGNGNVRGRLRRADFDGHHEQHGDRRQYGCCESCFIDAPTEEVNTGNRPIAHNKILLRWRKQTNSFRTNVFVSARPMGDIQRADFLSETRDRVLVRDLPHTPLSCLHARQREHQRRLLRRLSTVSKARMSTCLSSSSKWEW